MNPIQLMRCNQCFIKDMKQHIYRGIQLSLVNKTLWQSESILKSWRQYHHNYNTSRKPGPAWHGALEPSNALDRQPVSQGDWQTEWKRESAIARCLGNPICEGHFARSIKVPGIINYSQLYDYQARPGLASASKQKAYLLNQFQTWGTFIADYLRLCTM